ncbi:leucine-rich repeat neuronal protein 1-like [Saccostrea cucullata]|uniref:leucine-rich repeat neuronal protein 1-like n=1 Tax=Saccostrea cuccullata TaxID=36930 RepID=UPI002ED0104B
MLKVGIDLSVQLFSFLVMNFLFSHIVTFKSDATKDRDSNWASGLCPENCTCKMMDYPKYRSFFNKTVVCIGADFVNNVFPENVPLDVQILDLSHCHLVRLSLKLPLKNLRFLDISFNNLKTLDRQIHKLTALRQLIIQNNSISYLQNGAFSGMMFLEVLDLSNNQLYSIEPHTFGGLNYLKKLHLQGNRLRYLSPQWFISMPSLGWLFLSNNLIGRLKANVFEMLSGLFTMKLDENRISHIDSGAFNGLSHLRILDLTNNQLQTIPTQELHDLPLLQYLYFDKNPILRIPYHAFHSVNLTMLTMSYMPELKVIEKESFSNLKHLVTLQLHDNSELVYIDPQTFTNCARLKNLYLHNNKLGSVSSILKDSLPALKTLHLYNNELVCDCNAMWIKQENLKEKANRTYRSVLFGDSMLKCSAPSNKKGKLLRDLPLSDLNFTCAPILIPLFKNHYNLSIGEELHLECYTMGLPFPQISWRLPNKTILRKENLQSGRYKIHNNSTFILKYLYETDTGTYSCQAQSPSGFDVRSTYVTINNKPVRISPEFVAGNFITISWNGTRNQWSMTGYEIHYRQSDRPDKFQIIPLDRRLRQFRYTFTNLTPLTTYMFCIVYVFETELYTVHCTNITTNDLDFNEMGITHINSKMVIGVVTSIFMLLVLGCCVFVIRRVGKRKDYLEPLYSNDTESLMDVIPLESMYQGQTTPAACSSRTSLIQSQD